MANLKLPFSLFLALRYLKPKRTFLWIITIISVLGVTLGITVLIVVISVMTGFDRELQRKVLGFEPHIFVTSGGLLKNWRDVSAKIERQPHVTAVAPYVQGPVIADFEGRILTPVLRGIEPDKESKIINFKSLVREGTSQIEGENALIGFRLASALGVSVGDKITVYAPGNIRSVIDELKRAGDDPNAKTKTLAEMQNDVVMPADLTVAGIFESGRFEYDFSFILVPLHIAQELYALNDSVHGISVETDQPYEAESVKRNINKILELPVSAETWMDHNRDRFDAIRVERNVMFIVLMFLIVIAAFSIMNTLITVTVQKTREIGVMKALGARTWQIVGVFLSQGMLVGFFGNAIGLALGMTAIHYRNEFKDWLARVLHIQLFPADVYEFTSLPAEVVPADVAKICITAFLICAVAALLPAYRAARLDPAKALRYE
jgi:lipoprotein-releasing system permease protein